MSQLPPPGARHPDGATPVSPQPPEPPGELRQDPFSGHWAAITTGRAARPEAFLREDAPPRGPLGCPFCPGNEHMTPPEVWADRDPGAARADGPGWRVRVVPNKFPAFAGPPAPSEAGLYRAAPATGAHEVVVQSPDHFATLADLPEPDAARVVAAWRHRLAVRRDAPLGAAVVIVNQGRLAGASLEHPHSQLFATAIRPDLVAAELERLGRHDCAACAVLNKERGGERVVADADGLVTLCPWASAAPFEAMILPDQHLSRLGDPGGPEDLAVARALAGLLRRLDAAAGPRTPYNLVLHTAPPRTDDFHWHLHLLPRLTTYGGLELATGIIVNVVDPDHAAARYADAEAAAQREVSGS